MAAAITAAASAPKNTLRKLRYANNHPTSLVKVRQNPADDPKPGRKGEECQREHRRGDRIAERGYRIENTDEVRIDVGLAGLFRNDRATILAEPFRELLANVEEEFLTCRRVLRLPRIGELVNVLDRMGGKRVCRPLIKLQGLVRMLRGMPRDAAFGNHSCQAAHSVRAAAEAE